MFTSKQTEFIIFAHSGNAMKASDNNRPVSRNINIDVTFLLKFDDFIFISLQTVVAKNMVTSS